VLITIGSVTGVSIAALFTGGLLPGLVLGLVLCLVARWRIGSQPTRPAGEWASWSTIGRMFLIALPGIALPFVIRYAVVSGATTATEVSTIGIAYAVIVGLFVYRSFDLKRIMPMLIETASLSGAILLIIGAATAMSWALTQSGFSQALAATMAALPGGKLTFMAVSILAFVVLGSVLEGIPAIVLFGPLLFPIARTMGVHEVHYAMVVVLAMGVGLFAPPFGVGYYAACAVSRIHPNDGLKPIIPYVAALLVGIAVVAAIPWISIGFL
jgi:tripartite ATP-independent transporter DctM subunit